MEERSQQDNLRFDGISEYDNETWADTEEIPKYTEKEATILDKSEVDKKYVLNIAVILKRFPSPLIQPFWLSTCAVFPTLKLGWGDWEQGTENYITHFHENRDY